MRLFTAASASALALLLAASPVAAQARRTVEVRGGANVNPNRFAAAELSTGVGVGGAPGLPILPDLFVHLVSVATLAAQAPPSGTMWPIHDAPAALHPVISRADTIIVAMHDALLRELREGLARGGPVAAIVSCHVDAVGVSQRLARGEGIAAGRTSDRLRNPSNVPRPWAAALVKANAGRRMRDVEGFAVDLGDKVGVLRPIAQARTCVGCHGPVEHLTPAMRQLMAERYPHDRAVGFEEGQIRGWYWVEMPKPR